MKPRKPRPGAGLFAKRQMTEPRPILTLGEHATDMLTAQTLGEVDGAFRAAARSNAN